MIYLIPENTVCTFGKKQTLIDPLKKKQNKTKQKKQDKIKKKV